MPSNGESTRANPNTQASSSPKPTQERSPRNPEQHAHASQHADERRQPGSDDTHRPARAALGRAAHLREALLAAVPVGRREHGRVDGDRVFRLRDRRGRERRNVVVARRGRLRVVREEDERGPGRGHLDLAHVLRLVARHRLDVQVALPAPVGGKPPAKSLRGTAVSTAVTAREAAVA